MLNQETSKEQVCIWIIRFADYTLASFLGTYQQAIEKAEENKDLYGGSDTIAEKDPYTAMYGQGLASFRK